MTDIAIKELVTAINRLADAIEAAAAPKRSPGGRLQSWLDAKKPNFASSWPTRGY